MRVSRTNPLTQTTKWGDAILTAAQTGTRFADSRPSNFLSVGVDLALPLRSGRNQLGQVHCCRPVVTDRRERYDIVQIDGTATTSGKVQS